MKLNNYIDVISGYAFKSSMFNNSGEGLPVVRIRDVGKNKSNTFYKGDYPSEALINNGDYLIGMDGQFRLAEWNGGTALLNQRVCKIVVNEDFISGRYLLHIFT